ncbi:peptidase C14, caspase domain-containing protein [Blastocladiella britannica]|nr:peptidase C14, caspase domain-containing protein [Blastocladiella britannica]
MREKPPSRDAAAEAAAVHQAANPVVKWVNGYPQVATGGRKKALLIGINYTGTANALRGCHADVRNFKKFLVECNGFPDMPQTFRVLTDEEGTTRALLPTRKNMISGMQWLVKDAAPGDSLVMHFSGHGSQTRDFDGDEDDGMDETIIPLDFEALQSTPMAPKGMGHITDDEMHALLVAPLPAGVRLFCIFDSCHSGTALDLPVTYNADGTIAKKFTKQELLEAGAAVLLSGQNTDAAIGALQQAMTMVHQAPQDAARTHKAKLSKAHVVMLAGCKDMQTSADAKINGIATGAMSWAMLKAMREKPGLSTQQLLQVTRLLLGEHFSQIPQLSSGHPLDMDALFVL